MTVFDDAKSAMNSKLAAAQAAAAQAAAAAKAQLAAAAAEAAAAQAAAAAAARRFGTTLGGAVHVRLPEMAVSFARGAVIQAWLRPDRLQDATILELGQAGGVGRIALVCRQDALELHWHDEAGALWTATAAQCLVAGAWVHVSVALGAGDVVFYRNGAVVAATTPAAPPCPLEAARACNYIGRGAQAGEAAFAGAVADVRLWNREPGHDTIVARYPRALRGDEAGLCGGWTLEGDAGHQDRSCFARHATLVGGAWQPGAESFHQDPHRDAYALDLGAGVGKLAIGAFELTGAGFTWQAKVRVRDLARTATLLQLGGAGTLKLELDAGDLRCTLDSGKLLLASGVVRADTWVGLAVRQSVDGSLTAFVDGAPVGGPVPGAELRAGTYTGTVARLDGQLAELRLWSRGLSGAELADTAARRIHGWAPGLVGCWRMDDAQLSARPGLAATIYEGRDFAGASKSLAIGRHDVDALGIGNDRLSSLRVPFGLKVTVFEHGGFAGKSAAYTADCALVGANDQASSVVVEARPGLFDADPSGPATVVTDAAPAERGDLAFGRAPTVAPPRVAGFDGGQRLILPGLPQIGERGLSLQLWVRPDRLTDTTLLTLADSHRPVATGQHITLASTSAGDLTLAYSDLLWLQKLRVEGMFAAAAWTQLSVTIAADGVVCVYRDGQLVAREEHDAPRVAALGSCVLGTGLAGCLGELRVWSRALSAREIEHGWRRRLATGVGLVGRWALAGDLSGAPGPATGAPVWREAPALALTEGPPVTVATVTGQACLVADQTGKGGRPDLVLDLTATDAVGQPLVGAELTVVLDREAEIHRGTTLGPKLALTGAPARTLKITTGARGRVRLAMPASGLLAPIFRVRHAAMGEGEWALITPDQVIHQALASLTEQELTGGRKATSSTRAGATGLVTADADKLVTVLRGMMGAAAAFSFEAQSTAALAFGDDAELTPGPALAAGHGGNFRVDPATPLVRRLGAVLLADSATMPESFGLLGDVCSFVVHTTTAAVTTVAGVGKAAVASAVDTVEAVGRGVANATRAVVERIEVHVDMVIAGMKVAVKAVMTTVDDIVAAAVSVLAALGHSVASVLDFLADLFDWSDILATADLMQAELTRSLTTVKAGVSELFAALRGSIRRLEAEALTALGGRTSLPASVTAARQDVVAAGPPEVPGPLDYLLALLPDDLEQTIKDFRAVFAPIASVLTGALARLATLGDGLAREWNDPALQAALVDPRKLLDSDPSDWLAIARLTLRVATNGAVLVVDFVGDLAVAILDSFKRLLELHLQIPLLTAFVEQQILRGRALTVGTMLCLVPAIATTVAYKSITGREQGPAALASAGPRSFAGDDEPVDSLDIVLRGLDLVCAGVGGTIDSIEALTGKDPTKATAWAHWAFAGVGNVLGGAGLVKDTLGDPRSGWQWAKYGLDVASWGVGLVGWIAGGIDLYAENKAAAKVDNLCGAISDGLGIIAGSIDVAVNARDDESSRIDVTVAALDLTATLGSLVASIAGAVPEESAKEPISKAIRTGCIVGGNVANAGGKLLALGFVIGASVA